LAVGAAGTPALGTGAASGSCVVSGAIVAIDLNPCFVTLTPTIGYDGWSGPLSCLWEQIYGPAPAVIASPAESHTAIGFPDASGGYIFRLTVTAGAFSGAGSYRVYVFGSDEIETPEDVGDVALTVGGATYFTQINTCTVNETMGEIPNTCNFEVYGIPIAVGQAIILERGSNRLFAGIVLGVQQSKFERKSVGFHVWYSISAIGGEWHFKRRRVNKTYAHTSATTIAQELVAMVPNFTSVGVDAGLPTLTEFVASGTVGAVLTALAARVGLSWKLDYYGDVHLTKFEDSANDPQPLTESDLSRFSGLTVGADLSQVVTRVRVKGTISGITNVFDNAWAGELEVPSLDGYSPNGGTAVVGGKTIAYTGTRKGYKHQFLNNVVGVAVSSTSYDDPDGHISGEATYAYTFMSATGESGLIGAVVLGPSGSDNALHIKVRVSLMTTMGVNGVELVEAAKQLTGVTLYRRAPDYGGAFRAIREFSPLGGIHDDLVADDDEDWEFAKPAPQTGWDGADAKAYFLTGVTGIDHQTSTIAPVSFIVERNDLAAQAIIAALLGGGDDGVIEDEINLGESMEADAAAHGDAYLAERGVVNVQIAYSTKDPNSHPGQMVSMSLPDSVGVDDDLRIEQAVITGFEKRVSTNYYIRASKSIPLARFEALLQKLIRRS
jgi:hypothetical protein